MEDDTSPAFIPSGLDSELPASLFPLDETPSFQAQVTQPLLDADPLGVTTLLSPGILWVLPICCPMLTFPSASPSLTAQSPFSLWLHSGSASMAWVNEWLSQQIKE